MNTVNLVYKLSLYRQGTDLILNY